MWATTTTISSRLAHIARGDERLIGTIYKCEICRTESQAPVRWFVIHCSDTRLQVYKWTTEEADRQGALHFCGEGHAQVYISRWFESFCGAADLRNPH